MKKRRYAIIMFITLIILFLIINNKTSLDFSIYNLRAYVASSSLSGVIFVGLWIMRLVMFIPGMTLMVLGGLIFSPFEAFTLSLVGLVISDSLVFIVGKGRWFKGLRNKLEIKYSDILALVQKYNYKFLALGVLCPVAPTDVICYLSSYLGIGYLKYILTFTVANIPAVFLYSYLGESFNESIYNTLFIVVTLIATSLLSLNVWNKIKGNINETQMN